MPKNRDWLMRNVDFARKFLTKQSHQRVSVTATFGRGRRWKSTLLSPRYDNEYDYDKKYQFAHAVSYENTHVVIDQEVFCDSVEDEAAFMPPMHQKSNSMQQQHQHVPAVPTETLQMNLSQAARHADCFDKILLLVCNAEPDTKTGRLSGRGAGQALDLSRTTANYCNEQAGLVPELVVLSNNEPVIQTTMKAFPYYTPLEIDAVPWIAHPLLQQQSFDEQEDNVMYICDGNDDDDDSEGQVELGNNNNNNSATIYINKDMQRQQLEQTDEFLKWIQGRKEKVIVVSSQSQWLESFGTSLGLGNDNIFGFGEMRAVGVNFMN